MEPVEKTLADESGITAESLQESLKKAVLEDISEEDLALLQVLTQCRYENLKNFQPETGQEMVYGIPKDLLLAWIKFMYYDTGFANKGSEATELTFTALAVMWFGIGVQWSEHRHA